MTTLALLLWLLAAPKASPAAAAPAPPADPWTPIRPLAGTWRGTAEGQPGKGTVERSYRFVLGDRFLHETNVSTYRDGEGRVKERHEHWSFFSYDKARKALVLRQLHQEGFVNTYAYRPDLSAPPAKLVFESEAFENLPAGWKARETYDVGTDRIVETFELAPPGKELEPYSRTVLERAR